MCEPKLHYIHFFSPLGLSIEFKTTEYNVSESENEGTVLIIVKSSREPDIPFIISFLLSDITPSECPIVCMYKYIVKPSFKHYLGDKK